MDLAHTRGGDHDALDGTRKDNLVEHRLDFTLRRVGIPQFPGMADVKIHDEIVIEPELLR